MVVFMTDALVLCAGRGCPVLFFMPCVAAFLLLPACCCLLVAGVAASAVAAAVALARQSHKSLKPRQRRGEGKTEWR